ncbi:unnamed protein product, partial [Rotaria magnacalcarata]
LTSVREEPLISSSSSSSSSRDKRDTENNNDDDQAEIETNEKRPLLTLRPNSLRAHANANKNSRSTANMFFNDLNEQEGFVEMDPGTGRRIPH